jgi:hypothetical protein
MSEPAHSFRENVLIWNKENVEPGEVATDLIFGFQGKSGNFRGDMLDLRGMLDGQDTDHISFRVTDGDVNIRIEVGEGPTAVTQEIILDSAAFDLGMADNTSGGYDELARHIFLLTNASS